MTLKFPVSIKSRGIGKLPGSNSEIPDSNSGPQRSLQTQDSEIPDSNSGPQRSYANSLYLYLGSDSNFQSWPQGPQGPKMFRIPRVRSLKLHFPPCNVTQPTLLDTLQPSAAPRRHPAAPRRTAGARPPTHAATAHAKPPRTAGGRALGPTLGWAPPRRPIQLASPRHGNCPPAAHAPPLKTPQEQMALPRRILRGHPNPYPEGSSEVIRTPQR